MVISFLIDWKLFKKKRCISDYLLARSCNTINGLVISWKSEDIWLHCEQPWLSPKSWFVYTSKSWARAYEAPANKSVKITNFMFLVYFRLSIELTVSNEAVDLMLLSPIVMSFIQNWKQKIIAYVWKWIWKFVSSHHCNVSDVSQFLHRMRWCQCNAIWNIRVQHELFF